MRYAWVMAQGGYRALTMGRLEALSADRDLDVVVSGDGDPHVYWLEQTAPGTFATHVLEDRLPQAGGMIVVDLDGDGRNEVVAAGYENNLVLIYQRQ